MKRKRKLSIFGNSHKKNGETIKETGGIKFSEILDSDNLGYFKSMTQKDSTKCSVLQQKNYPINDKNIHQEPGISNQSNFIKANTEVTKKPYFLRQSFDNSSDLRNLSLAKNTGVNSKSELEIMVPKNYTKYDIAPRALDQIKSKARSGNYKNHSQILKLIDDSSIQQAQICDAKDFFDKQILSNVVQNTDKQYASLILSSAHNQKQEAIYKVEKNY